MSAISFKLETFEGPLDLLLFLISKHKLNIYDVEISLLFDQYMEYMNSIDTEDLDAAGDFLAMAARLVYIKTFSLLPHPEEAEQLKKELEGSLIEYSACKAAAENLRKICVYGDVFVRPPEEIPINKVFTGTMALQKLIDAYMGMTVKARRAKPLKAEQFKPIVSARVVTIESRITYVLKKLYSVGLCLMDELYEGITNKSERVATFLAVLELTKSGRIYLNDDNTALRFNRDSGDEPIKPTAEEPEPEAKEADSEPVTCEPENNAPEQPVQDKKSVSDTASKPPEKYALASIDNESRLVTHHAPIAVPAFILIENTIENTESVTESRAGKSSDLKSGDLKSGDLPTVAPQKSRNRHINRFFYYERIYWGNLRDKGNCWEYKKERRV